MKLCVLPQRDLGPARGLPLNPGHVRTALTKKILLDRDFIPLLVFR